MPITEHQWDELKGEDDPNKVGSTAWKNAAANTVLHTQQGADTQNRAVKDIENYNKDAEEFKRFAGATDPAGIAKATAAVKDMHAMLADVIAAVAQLASAHQDTRQLKADMEQMRQQMARLDSRTNFHQL